MTLLASERSLLIRNKFRSVLQLRIQNRRQQKELNATAAGVNASCSDKVGEKEANSAVHQTVDGSSLKSPPSALTAETAQDRATCGAQRQKKARLTENVSEKIPRQPGSLELVQKQIIPIENTPVSFTLPSDVFEDDILSCSSASPEQLGNHQSPSFSSSPGLSSDQLLSDGSPVSTPINHSPSSIQQCSSAVFTPSEGINESVTVTTAGSNSTAMTGRPKGMYTPSQTSLLPKTAQPPTPPTHSILGGSLPSPRPPRPRKPRECKPKMRKLKYHQYIPPDQRGSNGGPSGNNSQKNSASQVQPIDPAYSRLVHQQQVFLQLQILNQQQQLTVTTSEDQAVRFSGAGLQPAPPATNPTLLKASSPQKLELLPPNLDDLTVSELRQQLRKRGLTVSGTKPALLERLRPFQMPRPQLTPAPFCLIEGTINPSPPPSHSPTNADSSSSPSHIYIQSSEILEQGLVGATYLTPSPSSAGSSPNLQASSPPVPSGAFWRTEQAAEELSVELEMRERIRSRPREKKQSEVRQPRGSLHPFLQQDPGCSRGKPETEKQEMLFTPAVFSCPPCDNIAQDFELPMQITASPEQAPPPAERSLEELLQEAIQKVQMDPHESIDDILEDPVTYSDNAPVTSDLQSSISTLTGSSPTPPPDQLPPTNLKDETGLSSPLCSSLLLELPPSPACTPTLNPSPVCPPPPPPVCTTFPLRSSTRKRRSAVPAFDAADWLESLTSGLHPLTPPAAPFVESDFSLDSDLNINRVLDLMVEQW
ncbi:myocardin isoform X2 [Trichomycterus rosablanca]|uniref:myocardin isoform X2 n=1 Tax=Trichomycterus rosablanca TaxID=2290929 RepID=UPI002F3573DD